MHRLAYKTGLRLASFRFIRSAIDDHADLSGMSRAMIWRMVGGLVVIAASNGSCWPIIGVVTGMSVHYKKPLIMLIGCPLVYGIEFVLCGIGMAMAGGKGARVFLRWRARVWTEWLLEHGLEKYSHNHPGIVSEISMTQDPNPNQAPIAKSQ